MCNIIVPMYCCGADREMINTEVLPHRMFYELLYEKRNIDMLEFIYLTVKNVCGGG